MLELQPSILVVDDEESARVLLMKVLERGGYTNLLCSSSVDDARAILDSSQVDVVLTDMQMPGDSGLDLMSEIQARFPRVAALMVTGIDDPRLGEEALSLGAYGYILKPFRATEVLVNVSNALRRRDLEEIERTHQLELEEVVEKRTAELRDVVAKLRKAERSILSSRAETIEKLAVAAEFRDAGTGLHVARMSRYSGLIARRWGLDEEEAIAIQEASGLHDVGKISTPDHILLKPAALTPAERSVMQRHVDAGYRILAGSHSPLLSLAATIALTHHEKYDGSGYPRGLKGPEIPVPGRIAAIADVFDALTTNRVYRPAYDVDVVVDMMKASSGAHFDPELLQLFLDVLPEALEIKSAYEPCHEANHAGRPAPKREESR